MKLTKDFNSVLEEIKKRANIHISTVTAESSRLQKKKSNEQESFECIQCKDEGQEVWRVCES
ncbi:hypothetical protein ACFP56_08640 [Paenibacillus septentrionalis]|uniref:Uncharacterized protein n=1 Tax=Paenibacillus septentrionalis TaxID=429342 RepID=A0ABW1V3Y0_9BACL